MASAVAIALAIPASPAAAGLAAAPYLVKDINPSGASSPGQLTSVGGALYFTADDGTYGRELWRSDGTEGGTTLVKDIRPGAASANPRALANIHGVLYFSAHDGSHGRELWKSDGTSAGTEFIKDIRPGSAGSDPTQLTAVGATTYFVAGSYRDPTDVWKTDGTEAGTEKLDLDATLPPNQHALRPQSLTSFWGRLWFSAAIAGNTDVRGAIYVSDGMAAGAKPIAFDWVYPAVFAEVGSTLYFQGAERYLARAGSPTDVYRIGRVYPEQLTDLGGTLLFRGHRLVYDGTEYVIVDAGLWKSDGTRATTNLVKELDQPDQLTSVGTKLFLTLDDGADLWTSDGTDAGTARLFDGNTHSSTRDLTKVGNWLYYTLHGNLWKSDGTESGTQSIYSTGPGNLKRLTRVGGTLYFSADDLTGDVELWRYVP